MNDVLDTARRALAAQGVALAEALRARGLSAELDGDVVRVSGPGLAAQEFGSPRARPRPVVAPLVETFTPLVARAVADALGKET
jgi:hypothetical protein